jgi:8-oxo-dGTP diphosphatase
MNIRPSVALIEAGKIMLLRYSYSGKDLYQLPGGNSEDAETLEDTLSRELQEEAHLNIEVHNLLLVAQVLQKHKNEAKLHCLFKGSVLPGQHPQLDPAHTSALEAVWVDIKELPSLNLYPAVGKQLLNILESPSSETKYLGQIEQPWL